MRRSRSSAATSTGRPCLTRRLLEEPRTKKRSARRSAHTKSGERTADGPALLPFDAAAGAAAEAAAGRASEDARLGLALVGSWTTALLARPPSAWPSARDRVVLAGGALPSTLSSSSLSLSLASTRPPLAIGAGELVAPAPPYDARFLNARPYVLVDDWRLGRPTGDAGTSMLMRLLERNRVLSRCEVMVDS